MGTMVGGERRENGGGWRGQRWEGREGRMGEGGRGKGEFKENMREGEMLTYIATLISRHTLTHLTHTASPGTH